MGLDHKQGVTLADTAHPTKAAKKKYMTKDTENLAGLASNGHCTLPFMTDT